MTVANYGRVSGVGGVSKAAPPRTAEQEDLIAKLEVSFLVVLRLLDEQEDLMADLKESFLGAIHLLDELRAQEGRAHAAQAMVDPSSPV